MAAHHSTRRSAGSSPSVKSDRAKPRKGRSTVRKDDPYKALRSLPYQVRDPLHTRLLRTQWALVTAIMALEGRGLVDISMSLRAHVHSPLCDFTDALDGKKVRN
jgi:hypothetical protein